jgi:hypothetical protein
MNYEKFNPHYHKPAKFTGEAYGVKTSVEHDHSDLDIDQLMDAFETIAIGLGYHTNSWKQWILDRADEYRETDAEELKEKLDAWKFEDDDDFFADWDEQRMDVIGQNGNEGLHYRATEEDEAEFDDYGMRIPEDRVSFEWGDEPEDEDNLFEGDEWKLNENLKAANERYKSEVKKMNNKKKNKKK